MVPPITFSPNIFVAGVLKLRFRRIKFIDRAPPFEDHAVDRNALAGTNPQAVANGNLF